MDWLIKSSVNADKIALTVKGILVGLVPTLLLIARVNGWEIGEEGIMGVIDAIVNVISTVGSALGAILTLWGLTRKIIVWFKNKNANQ